MKKINLLILSLFCLCSLAAFATHDNCCKEPQPAPKCETPCPQTYDSTSCDYFLCTDKNMNTIFSGMNLSNAQICNAQKIQEKYEQEVLSLEEKLECENAKLSELEESCASASEIRKQKNAIKELEKTKKKICECYESQFKATLSSDQERIYNKNKK